jgi:hypothetical protein
VFSILYFSGMLLIGPNSSTTNFPFTDVLSTFNSEVAIVFSTSLSFSPPPLISPFYVSIQGGDFCSSVPISLLLLALVMTTSSTSSTRELFQSMLSLFNMPFPFTYIAIDGKALRWSSLSPQKVYSSSKSYTWFLLEAKELRLVFPSKFWTPRFPSSQPSKFGSP